VLNLSFNYLLQMRESMADPGFSRDLSVVRGFIIIKTCVSKKKNLFVTGKYLFIVFGESRACRGRFLGRPQTTPRGGSDCAENKKSWE
jgi:hypothetical protein